MYLFTTGASCDGCRMLLREKMTSARLPVHVVAWNCTDPDTIAYFKDICKLSGGRWVLGTFSNCSNHQGSGLEFASFWHPDWVLSPLGIKSLTGPAAVHLICWLEPGCTIGQFLMRKGLSQDRACSLQSGITKVGDVLSKHAQTGSGGTHAPDRVRKCSVSSCN